MSKENSCIKTDPPSRNLSDRQHWSSHIKPRWINLLIATVPAAIGFVTFLHASANGFVDFDDFENFTNNPNLNGISFRSLFWSLTTFTVGVYQPLAWMVMEAEYSIWATDPKKFHYFSITLHSANCFLLFLAILSVLRLSQGVIQTKKEHRFGALLASLIFSVHPINTEVVAWASCQPYLLSLSFSLAALILYVKSANGKDFVDKLSLVASWVFAICALSCKAAAVGLPFTFVLLEWFIQKKKVCDPFYYSKGCKNALKKTSVVFLAAFFFAYQAARARRTVLAPQMESDDFLKDKLARGCFSIFFYLQKLVLPTGLSPFYNDSRPAYKYLGVTLCLLLAVSCLIFLRRNSLPTLFYCWFSYLFALTPVAGFVKSGWFLGADRYFYLSSVFTYTYIAFVFSRIYNTRAQIWLTIATSATIVLLYRSSIIQVEVWNNSVTLWSRVVECGGGRDDRILNYLGVATLRVGDVNKSIGIFEQALRLNPTSPHTHNNLGLALQRKGQLSEAIDHFDMACQIDWSLAPIHNNLGLALQRKGQLSEAIDHFDMACQIDPNLDAARISAGLCCISLGRRSVGKKYLADSLRKEPQNALILNALGVIAAEDGQMGESLSYFSKALRFGPGFVDVRINIKKYFGLDGL